jgi:hypothetical protein
MRFAIALMFLASATPALAANTAVPEPSSMVLLGIAVIGVIVGRQGSRRRKD